MRDLAERALDAATGAGAAYADVRVAERATEVVEVRNGQLLGVDRDEDEGIGIRVLVDGAWGFAAVGALDGRSVEAAALRAVRIARASARVGGTPVHLAPVPVVVGSYTTPVAVDPFGVSPAAKADLLMRVDAAMARVPAVTVRNSSTEAVREHRLFASSEGSRIEQTIIETGSGFDATATSDDEVQTRSFPNSFGRHQLCAGWEAVEEMDLEGNAERIASEAVQLLTADRCPTGVTTLILDASQVALQVHESCGHPTELDRVLGSEAAYAGTSFLTPDLVGNFMYGSGEVTIVADATCPRGLGTFGWDDEGVPAQRTLLVDRGVFSGYLSSRESASSLGLSFSSGAMRASSWARIPLVRMTNINLEPGTSSLEEMIATTEAGIYLETNRSWSIDDRRLNFQFGCQLGWEIRDGQRVRMVRNGLYSGTTPRFWGSCDAAAGPDEWRLFGVVNCGKGEPGQIAHVGHGAPPARFRNVMVTSS
ncbi:MAG TPA: TldD/PmbA family protein [Candidatus Dormibacteraeota bacterium]|nr:TldD/PmbA family protein [Candidatus Dormibacteraeota bacterium]